MEERATSTTSLKMCDRPSRPSARNASSEKAKGAVWNSAERNQVRSSDASSLPSPDASRRSNSDRSSSGVMVCPSASSMVSSSARSSTPSPSESKVAMRRRRNHASTASRGCSTARTTSVPTSTPRPSVTVTTRVPGARSALSVSGVAAGVDAAAAATGTPPPPPGSGVSDRSMPTMGDAGSTCGVDEVGIGVDSSASTSRNPLPSDSTLDSTREAASGSGGAPAPASAATAAVAASSLARATSRSVCSASVSSRSLGASSRSDRWKSTGAPATPSLSAAVSRYARPNGMSDAPSTSVACAYTVTAAMYLTSSGRTQILHSCPSTTAAAMPAVPVVPAPPAPPPPLRLRRCDGDRWRVRARSRWWLPRVAVAASAGAAGSAARRTPGTARELKLRRPNATMAFSA